MKTFAESGVEHGTTKGVDKAAFTHSLPALKIRLIPTCGLHLLRIESNDRGR